MRVPQVSERIKEAPVVVLRGMLAGIGQVLLITDKLRNKAPEEPAAAASAPAAAAGPVSTAPVPHAAPTSASAPASASASAPAPTSASASAPADTPPKAATPRRQKRNPDETGNVRLISETEAAPDAGVTVAKKAKAAAVDAAVVSASAAQAEDAQAGAAQAEDAQAEAAQVSAGSEAGSLPLDNYDDLSLASIRARLRNLSVAQVTELAGYERAHAARPEIVAMLDRRIAKLESGDA